MKKIVSVTILALACITLATSCKKEYKCYCDIKYVSKSNGQIVNTTTSSQTITTRYKEDAQKQCKYFEQEIDYLNQKTTVQNYCAIK